MRWIVYADGLTTRPILDRRYAVVDGTKLDNDGRPLPGTWALQTDDGQRAAAFAEELNNA